MASDIESTPSAVATTLPLMYPISNSAIPMLIRVITEILAILCPALNPSFTSIAKESLSVEVPEFDVIEFEGALSEVLLSKV